MCVFVRNWMHSQMPVSGVCINTAGYYVNSFDTVANVVPEINTVTIIILFFLIIY